jgi:hypothetical protein
MAKVQPFRARRGARRDVAGDRVMDGIVIVIVIVVGVGDWLVGIL